MVEPFKNGFDYIGESDGPWYLIDCKTVIGCILSAFFRKRDFIVGDSKNEYTGVSFNETFYEFHHERRVVDIRRSYGNDGLVFSYEIVQGQVVYGYIFDPPVKLGISSRKVFCLRHQFQLNKISDGEHKRFPPCIWRVPIKSIIGMRFLNFAVVTEIIPRFYTICIKIKFKIYSL